MGSSNWMQNQDGNFSNSKDDTFDPANGYVGIRLQQGVPLLDRDWNELEDIRRYEMMSLRKNYIGNGSPDKGFKILATEPSSNDFRIMAGTCMVEGLEAMNAPAGNDHILYSEQQDAPALTSPASDRTDTVYIDVWIEEVMSTGGSDPLQNPQDVGVVTCVRHRLRWQVRVDEGSGGYEKQPYHYYYDLATITRTAGTSSIDNISDLREVVGVAGALVSVDGVRSAGGNIDLAGVGSITISPDDANNRITIGETHSSLTDNPHGTTAAQVDAQGGTNRIVAQINEGTGVIDEARIAPLIARASEVATRFATTDGHDHDGANSKKIPALSSTHFADLSGANLTALDGSQITTGTIAEARIDVAIARDAEVNAKFDAAFDITAGHNHDGQTSRQIPPDKLLGVDATVTAGNLNVLAKGLNSDASSLHCHKTIPTQTKKYHVARTPFPNGAFNPFKNSISKIWSVATEKAQALFPLHLPDSVKLTKITVYVATASAPFSLKFDIRAVWPTDDSSVSADSLTVSNVSGESSKDLSSKQIIIDNSTYSWVLLVSVVTPGTADINIHGIILDYELTQLY